MNNKNFQIKKLGVVVLLVSLNLSYLNCSKTLVSKNKNLDVTSVAEPLPIRDPILPIGGNPSTGNPVTGNPNTESPNPPPATTNPSPEAQDSAAFASQYKHLTGYSGQGSEADPITNMLTFKHFREIYSPNRMKSLEWVQQSSDRPGKPSYIIQTRNNDTYAPAPSVLVPKFRIYLPPGTTGVQVSIFAYYLDGIPFSQAATYRFGQEPILKFDQLEAYESTVMNTYNSNSGRDCLKYLFSGVEWGSKTMEAVGINIVPGIGGGGSCQEGSQNVYVSQKGGYLYANVLQAAGDRVQEIVTKVTVDQAVYDQWYKNAKWDADGNPL